LAHPRSAPNVGSSKANQTFLKGREISELTLSGHLREALFRLQSSFRVRVLSKPALAQLYFSLWSAMVKKQRRAGSEGNEEHGIRHS
jgi:hypothetical protein